MEQHAQKKIVHYYDRELQRILCGVVDPGAHWTIRSRVNCELCSTLLRERRLPVAAPEAAVAADA
ncbi:MULTISPECIES: hypothetical protein [unclassified Anaeromyxobacter]|uniref:hypothetical protein n=1 Tax=unclassified Anaeromyxobacter TaxID=2620896 RepID=UPI001F582AC6|nr:MULTISPECIES: hypothetical protein [unclassified Anaeromyxobacter]